jgi:hypothetical protein
VNRKSDVFQTLILREALADRSLRVQIRVAEAVEWLGRVMAVPVARIVQLATSAPTGVWIGIPSEVTKLAIENITNKSNTLGYARRLISTLAKARLAHEAYECCWRSALCYGVIGWRDEAFRVLEGEHLFPAGPVRHHHVLGLLQGSKAELLHAFERLNTAYVFENSEPVRLRVAEGLSVASVGEGCAEPSAAPDRPRE